VVAPFSGKPGHRVHVRARRVVLSAGCMATPVLLQKSGDLANGSGQVGANLQFHPGIAMVGVFPELVHPQFGATQGYQSLHFLRRGFKLETLWAPPAVLAVRMPGSGLALKQRLALAPHSAVWDGIASCNRSLGTVRARSRGFDPKLTWNFHPDDVPILADALHTLAQIFFAAGAKVVIPGVHGIAEELHSLEEAEVLRTRAFRASEFVTASNHAFCTTRMHGDPRRGVVDELGRCHDLDGLYIADTGVFPQCPSVNPMWTGMALAHRTAEAIAAGA
jgi:choline dehydrogenase-like flavoprotein